MLWLRYSATFPDFSVAMTFTEWHIVHVYPSQCSTNSLKLYNAAYIQFSLFSLFVFHTFFFFTIATLVCSPIYLTMLWWPVHMKAHPLVWFEHFLLYFKEYKRFRYKFKKLTWSSPLKQQSTKTYKNLQLYFEQNVQIELQKKGKAKTENISWLLIIVDKDSSPHNKRCVLITQKWPSCSRNLWK